MPTAEEMQRRMSAQRAEFDAVYALASAYNAMAKVPVVDDDYLRARHLYERALADFLREAKANGRAVEAASGKPPIPPFSFGSDVWPGLAKLLEECGEVAQVGGKLMMTGGEAAHWDGSNLHSRMIEELGDLLAAIRFVIAANELPEERIEVRASRKIGRFLSWAQEQREKGGAR